MTPEECAAALQELANEIDAWASAQPALPGLVRMLADYVTAGQEWATELARQVAALTAAVEQLQSAETTTTTTVPKRTR